MFDRRVLLGALAAGLAGCASPSIRTSGGDVTLTRNIAEPPMVLFPGDEIDLALPSAAELNRTLTVGPDGRISLPLAGHLMVAEQSLHQAEANISTAYADYLVRPAAEVTLRRAAPAKIWIDGQVRNPGAFDLPGDAISVYQAILLAGGATTGAKARKAVLIRRSADGHATTHLLDLRASNLSAPRARRGDIIFVPRNGLGEIAAFLGQVREALPVGFSYALNGRWN